MYVLLLLWSQFWLEISTVSAQLIAPACVKYFFLKRWVLPRFMLSWHNRLTVISNTGNNDQTGVASYGQKTPSWPAQYTVCNVQCMHNGPKLGTWSSWGPNCWNGPHLVLIHTRGLIFSIMREKWQWSCEKGREKYQSDWEQGWGHATPGKWDFVTVL